jgi:adenylylsulfate kinase-like enzyme
LEVCKDRDPYGLYKRPLKGEICELPGISSPYEQPQGPEAVIESDLQSTEERTLSLVERLKREGIL